MKRGPVFIQITDQHALSSDQYQWIIKYRPRKKEGDGFGEWSSQTYHSSLNSMIRHLKEDFARDCGAQNATELYDAAVEIDKLFAKKHFKIMSEVTIK